MGAFTWLAKEAYCNEMDGEELAGLPVLNIVRMVEEDDVVMTELSREVPRVDGEIMRMAVGEAFVMRDAKIAERPAF